MRWFWLDLLLFSGATYGIAWVITRSKIMKRPRDALANVPFLGELLQCIVCMATWVGLGLLFLLPFSHLFSPAFRVKHPVDALFLLGWIIASCWALGRLLGDAD